MIDYFNTWLVPELRYSIAEHLSVKDLFVYGRVSKAQHADNLPLQRIKKLITQSVDFICQRPETLDRDIFSKRCRLYDIAKQASHFFNSDLLQIFFDRIFAIPRSQQGWGIRDKQFKTSILNAIECMKRNETERARELFSFTFREIKQLPRNYNKKEGGSWKTNDIYYLQLAKGLFKCSFYENFCIFNNDPPTRSSLYIHYEFIEKHIEEPQNKCRLLQIFIKTIFKKGAWDNINLVDFLDQKLDDHLGEPRPAGTKDLIPQVKKMFFSGNIDTAYKILKATITHCIFLSPYSQPSMDFILLMARIKELTSKNRLEEAEENLKGAIVDPVYQYREKDVFKVCIQLGYKSLIPQLADLMINKSDPDFFQLSPLVAAAAFSFEKGYEEESDILVGHLRQKIQDIIQNGLEYSTTLRFTEAISDAGQETSQLSSLTNFLLEMTTAVQDSKSNLKEKSGMYGLLAKAFLSQKKRKLALENFDLAKRFADLGLQTGLYTEVSFYDEDLLHLIEKLAKGYFIDEAILVANQITAPQLKASALVHIIKALSKAIRNEYRSLEVGSETV